jgi:hypothetical protein
MKRELLGTAILVLIASHLSSAEAPSTNQPPRSTVRNIFGTTNTVRRPILAEIERAYLDGKISARDYQRFLHAYRPPPVVTASAPEATNDVHARALEVLRNTAPNPAANPQGPAVTQPLAGSEPETGSTNAAELQNVETKLDELIRKKEAREQGTNASPASIDAALAALKTKRERLDFVLKLYIQDKLTDTEYKERREKILAAPE